VSAGSRDAGPPRKGDWLEVNEVSDGYVIYDSVLDRVHHLNRTAALVFELCTGENDAATIAGVIASAYDLDEPPEAEVAACVERLRREGLLR